MARTLYNYLAAGAAGTTFANADTTKAVAVGATTTNITNGTLTVSSDAPTGLSATGSVEGTVQNVSGTTYISHTITSTKTLSLSIWWKMPTSVGTIGATLAFVGNGGTRQFQVALLSTEQIRVLNAANATINTTTFSGGFVAGTWYRTDIYAVQDATAPSTTNGTYSTATYDDSAPSTPLTGTVMNATNVDVGTLGFTSIRHGTRTGTGTADENVRVAVGYDTTQGVLLGPATTNVSSTVTTTGTASVTTTGVVGKVGGATVAGTAATTATGVVGKVSGATVAGTASVTSAASVGTGSGVSIAGTASVTASAVVGKVSSTVISGTANVTATGAVAGAGVTGTATITGTSAVTASATVGTGSGVAISGTASMVATAAVQEVIVNLSSDVTITGTASVEATAIVGGSGRDITVSASGPYGSSPSIAMSQQAKISVGSLFPDTIEVYGPIGENA